MDYHCTKPTDNLQIVDDGNYPSTMRWWMGGDLELAEEGSTHFFFVTDGQLTLSHRGFNHQVAAGFGGCVPGRAVFSGNGQALIATRHQFLGMLRICGPIEQQGRLRYIDGCSSTVLVDPLRVGDPCLNFLHVPPNVNQTAHTHPTVRFGVVVGGSGICKTVEQTYHLERDNFFLLPPDAVHSFHTTDSSLRIVVYHPDSEQGPSDDSHNMLNRTIIDGIPAHKRRLQEAQA